MDNNLYVSFDLITPGEHYPEVEAVIKELGNWAKIHSSLYYVKTSLTNEEATKHVWAAMDPNDKLIVIDATHNTARWFNLEEPVEQQLIDQWPK